MASLLVYSNPEVIDPHIRSGDTLEMFAIACGGSLVCSNIHAPVLVRLVKRLKRPSQRVKARDLPVTIAP